MKVYRLYPLVILFLVLAVYIYGINGSFQHDDMPNIVENTKLHIEELTLENMIIASMSSDSGLLKRPVSMATFAINHYFGGLNPHAFKATNVAIHAINAIAIYWLCLLLLNSFGSDKYNINNHTLALIISVAWCLHPINLTSVLYVVQRMTSLATLFVILAIGCYLTARKKLIEGNYKKGFLYLSLVVIFGIIGVFSKENAALLFIYLLLLEVILHDKKATTEHYKKIVYVFFSIFLIAPLLFVIGHTIINPDWIFRGYNNTLSFNLTERLLTELRIVWMYISWILLPNNKNLGLFHDDIEISTSLFDSTLPIFSGIGHLAVFILLGYLWRTKNQKLFVLGCSLFYASHLMESTILSLMLTFEHRNYFGSFGLMLALFSVLFSVKKKYLKYSALFSVCFILLLALQTSLRSLIWADSINYAFVNVTNHPSSAKAHYELGLQYSKTGTPVNLSKAKQEFIISSELNNEQAASLFALLSLSYNDGDEKPLEKIFFKNLLIRLNTQPVFATNIAWINRLVNCYIDQTCMINKHQIDTILHAILTNKNLENNPLYNSYLLMMKARLLATIDNEYEKALKFTNLAAKASPKDIRFIINTYHLAMSRNDHDTAQSAIDDMKELTNIIHEMEINRLNMRLAKARKKTDNAFDSNLFDEKP